ncbi:hypothetical protein RZS08_01860, partial [Arthrospira platensis SPKY1]|nr:hypothetical protein [Arthrospira platensis SPKY1]
GRESMAAMSGERLGHRVRRGFVERDPDRAEFAIGGQMRTCRREPAQAGLHHSTERLCRRQTDDGVPVAPVPASPGPAACDVGHQGGKHLRLAGKTHRLTF